MNTIARNNDTNATIRFATTDDAVAICEIYAPYVLNTAITFDTCPPTPDEMREKIAATLLARPFLVAETTEMHEILGYAYASAFRPREAYIHAVETSIYLRPEAKGFGLGRRLYSALEEILRLQNITTANACISFLEQADAFAPDTSRLFHERMGYVFCGCIPNCGRKFDRWFDIIWMQKNLASPTANPEPFIPLSDLDENLIDKALRS